MTRPAIIIGLGGTGQWVLTFLKKELLEIGEGVLPSDVRLLCFDTTTRTTAGTGQRAKRDKDEDIRAGAVRLIEGKEFIPIGDNVGALVSEIAAGKHSHLRWFPASSFLSKLPPSAFNTKEGSGQVRQMGRMSLFRDLAAVNQSQVLLHLRTALQKLQGRVSRDMQLEIIIIGSLAGGTGAGMLVDVAYLVRAEAAKMVANNYVVRGFFVLPRAFTAGGLGEGRDMLARSFATWRELDRFMIVSERFGLHQMNYDENRQDLRIRLDRRAYDVSYMVDAARQSKNSLDNVRVEEGLFPSIAQNILAMLDEKAGREYTEFISTNLAGKLAQLPRRPYYSAIGSYTLKVPVYFAQEKAIHKLTLEVLQEFLAPQTNSQGRVIGVFENRNREVLEGQGGIQAALRFMFSSGINIAGTEIPNTKFLPLLAEIRAKEGLLDRALHEQIARGGLTIGSSRFNLALTDITQDEEGKLVMRDIVDELNHPIWRDVPPSRTAGDTPSSAFFRIKNRVPQVRQEHYGLDTASGIRLRGKYGKALEQAKNSQLARFHRLLSTWTIHTLNGDSTDPLVARSGKIGYVRSFYSALIDNFDYFVKFLNTVRQIRNENLRLAARTRQAADSALKEYERLHTKRSWLAFWDDHAHPDAHRAQRNYLMAEQRDIDVRKDDILLDVMAETAIEMQSYVKKGLDDIGGWIIYLASGDENTKVRSLYTEVMDSLANITINHNIDKRLEKVCRLISELEYPTDKIDVINALNRLKWQVNDAPDGIKITCGIDTPIDEENQSPKYVPFRQEKEATTFNFDLIMNLVKRSFISPYQERSLAHEVMKLYPTGEILATSVDKLAEPLYLPASTVSGPEIVACYVRIHKSIDEETVKYFGEFESEMKQRNTNIKGSSLTLADSEDDHRMTVVRSDDLMPSQDFQMWHACRDAYIQQVTDPHRGIPAAELHIFPAEINACSYEAEIPYMLGRNFHPLHPEVVAILEDKERFEMFFRAYALGFIKIQEEEGVPYWAYQLPDSLDSLYLSEPKRTLYGYRNEDIFQVIHNFVMEGADQRPKYMASRFVQWDRLRDAILNAHQELGKSRILKLYQQQIEDPKGIVETILTDIASKRATISDEILRRTVGQEYEDLADVAKVVYLKAIAALENLSAGRSVNASKPRSANKVNIVSFASEAGFELANTDTLGIYELLPDTSIFSAWFNKPIFACQANQLLDTHIISKFVENIQKIKKSGKDYENVVFIASDTLVPSVILELFMRIRAEKGIMFIPIDEKWVQVELARKELQEIVGSPHDLYDRRVPDPVNFFGRESVVADLQTRLREIEAIGLWGLRKIGKSSLLRYLRSVASFPVAHVDLQAGTDCISVFERALKSWEESSRSSRILWTSDVEYSKDAFSRFSTAVNLLRQSSLAEGKGIPVLLIDEIELILPKEGKPESVQNYLNFARMLRGLMQEGQLAVLFAGVDSTINQANRFNGEQNPFYQFLHEQYLGPISEKDCGEMITAIGSQMMLHYTPETLALIIRASGGHPFLARQICSTVYKSLPKGKREILEDDAISAIQRFTTQHPSTNLLNEQGLWGEMTNATIWGSELVEEFERILLQLAQNISDREENLLKGTPNRSLAERALKEMENRGILLNQSSMISIRFEVFLHWIQRYKLDKLK